MQIFARKTAREMCMQIFAACNLTFALLLFIQFHSSHKQCVKTAGNLCKILCRLGVVLIRLTKPCQAKPSIDLLYIVRSVEIVWIFYSTNKYKMFTLNVKAFFLSFYYYVYCTFYIWEDKEHKKMNIWNKSHPDRNYSQTPLLNPLLPSIHYYFGLVASLLCKVIINLIKIGYKQVQCK